MSATSGIVVSADLADKFAVAVSSTSVRFLKVLIRNESLVLDVSVDVSGSLDEDILQLQDILDDDVPAFLLVRLDDPSEWLAVYYVPDSAKVRDKMLYASTRNSLMKSLGSTHFVDSLFATSKADLTPEAYASHKRHVAAPKPLSAREQEMADIMAAERENGGGAYDGSRSRQNHLGAGVGLNWSPDVEDAVKELITGEGSRLVVINIDAMETLQLTSAADVSVDELSTALPSSEPSYAFFAWPHTHTSPPRREIVFIYSCPTSSPIKYRMVYSSGSSAVFQYAKSIIPSEGLASVFATRKIETSDPTELDELYLKSELSLDQGVTSSNPTPAETPEEKKAFAKPRGPGRRPR